MYASYLIPFMATAGKDGRCRFKAEHATSARRVRNRHKTCQSILARTINPTSSMRQCFTSILR